MDSMNHEYNFKHGLTEGEISKAVKDYKATHKSAFEAKMFAQLSDKEYFAESCAHDWRTHTTVNDTVPTGENHALSGAEINRLENRVTKVYCSKCLEVRGI